MRLTITILITSLGLLSLPVQAQAKTEHNDRNMQYQHKRSPALPNLLAQNIKPLIVPLPLPKNPAVLPSPLEPEETSTATTPTINVLPVTTQPNIKPSNSTIKVQPVTTQPSVKPANTNTIVNTVKPANKPAFLPHI